MHPQEMLCLPGHGGIWGMLAGCGARIFRGGSPRGEVALKDPQVEPWFDAEQPSLGDLSRRVGRVGTPSMAGVSLDRLRRRIVGYGSSQRLHPAKPSKFGSLPRRGRAPGYTSLTVPSLAAIEGSAPSVPLRRSSASGDREERAASMALSSRPRTSSLSATSA